MLKATDQGHKAQVFSKIKKVFAQKNSQICQEISGVLKKKKDLREKTSPILREISSEEKKRSRL